MRLEWPDFTSLLCVSKDGHWINRHQQSFTKFIKFFINFMCRDPGDTTMLLLICPKHKWVWPENENTVNLKSASFVIIMLLRFDSGTFITKACVAIWCMFHFNTGISPKDPALVGLYSRWKQTCLFGSAPDKNWIHDYFKYFSENVKNRLRAWRNNLKHICFRFRACRCSFVYLTCSEN